MKTAFKTSIDKDEIEKFSRLAETWWDAEGPFRPLHQINPVRIRYILESGNWRMENGKSLKPLGGLKILDIGCGGGLLSEPMARLGGSVTAIDASPKNIAIAKIHAAEEELDIDYRATSVEELPMLGNFDVILCMEVIEHVANVESFLRHISKLLAPNGILILSTINRTLKSLLLAKIGAEYILNWLPKGTHDWRKFPKPGEIEPLLRASGLKIKNLKGMSYAPFKDEWLLTDDISVNYFLTAVKT